jgi:hypothetical protein
VPAFLVVHLILVILSGRAPDTSRVGMSAILYSVTLLGAYFMSLRLVRIPARDLVKVSDAIIVFFVAMAIAAKLGVPPIGPTTMVKPIIVFQEPSHFGLALIPFLMFRVSISSPLQQTLLIAFAIGLALWLESLTLLAGAAFITVLLVRAGGMFVVFALLAVVPLVFDMTYYTSRLLLSSESGNMSTLIFLQGWQAALNSLIETRGLGIGFQQLGITSTTTELAERVARMAGGYVNVLDGGSTAPKFIAELGVLALVALIAYGVLALKGVRLFRASQTLPTRQRDGRRLFLYSLIIAYSFELFVRGLGYFSPGGLFFLASVMALRAMRQQVVTPVQRPSVGPTGSLATTP